MHGECRRLTMPDGSMLMAIYGGQRRKPGQPVQPDRDHSYVSIQDPSLYNGGTEAVFLSLPHEASAEAAGKFLKKGLTKSFNNITL